MVFTADYLRNVQTRSLLGIDVNQVGDVRHFDATAAANAIDATNASFGCGPGEAGGGFVIALYATRPPNKQNLMVKYAFNRLTSESYFGQACNQTPGVPPSVWGIKPAPEPA